MFYKSTFSDTLFMWGLLVFSEPFSKCSGRVSNIFLITFHPIIFISVDDPTFLHHRVLVLGGHQEVLDGDTSSEVNFTPCLLQVLFTLSLPDKYMDNNICPCGLTSAKTNLAITSAKYNISL